MQYKTLRILLSLISAAFATIIALVAAVLAFVGMVPDYWFLLITLPLGVLAYICSYIATGFYLGPLAKVILKVRQLSDGQLTVHFMDDSMTRAPLGVQELATTLDTVSLRVRNSKAEMEVESKRQRQFISDVSHELRTPLTAIRGAAETMMDEDMPYADRMLFCNNIVRESERLTRLANDLLNLQRIDGGGEIVLQRINLHDIVEYVASMLTPLLDERNTTIKIEGEAPDVLGDEDRLRQVAFNLIENASRFTDPEDGQIWVELSGVKGHSVVTVRDNGQGFGDVNPSRLFDRFYRGDSSRARATGGTGLGLTIVKSIVTMHDGTVEAFNLPAGGACFIVAIPSLPPRSE